MKKTLPRLSEYNQNIIERYKTDLKYDTVDFKRDISIYTSFITQQLNISHFVPAVFRDGVWVVLEEPETFQLFINTYKADLDKNGFAYRIECEEYQNALNNVVFKGFVQDNYNRPTKGKYVIDFGEKPRLCTETFNIEVNSLEDLIPYNLEITDKIAEKFKL